MTVGVEKLQGLAVGDTVRARYKTTTTASIRGSMVVESEVVSQVVEGVQDGWFHLQTPAGPIGLCQVGFRDVTHADLVQVVTVTKPPYADGVTQSEPSFGDVVECDFGLDEALHGRFLAILDPLDPTGWVWVNLAGGGIYKRQQLADRLRVVQRLQDWPAPDFEDTFDRAMRVLAGRVQNMPTPGLQWKESRNVLSRAAKLVEDCDLPELLAPYPDWD